jgi:hypothetical protein
VQFIEENQENADAVYTVGRLFAVSHPSSKRVLLSILERLVDEGILIRIVRVLSPANGGIQDFQSVMDVPDEIFDWRRGVMMEVSPEQIQQAYKLHG